MTNSLVEIYQTLPVGVGEGRFSTALIGGGPHRVARDESGGPVLLVAVQPSDNSSPPPLVLEHLRVQHDVKCLVARADGSEEERTFTLVRCTSPELGEHFLRVLGPIVETLGTVPTRAHCARTIRRLADLFEALQRVPTKTAQGLFAELVILDGASEPLELARAWHAEPEDRFDFNSGCIRVEVKSTSGERRIHHFSLEQIRPPADIDVYIASLRVVRAASGLSLAELLDRVRSKISSEQELLLRFDYVVSKSLGRSVQRALRERYDEQIAQASVRLYRGEDVPSVDPAVPAGVKGVEFTSELDQLSPLSASALEVDHPILASLAGALPHSSG